MLLLDFSLCFTDNRGMVLFSRRLCPEISSIELRNLGLELSRLSFQYLENAATKEKMRSDTKWLESKLRQSQKNGGYRGACRRCGP